MRVTMAVVSMIASLLAPQATQALSVGVAANAVRASLQRSGSFSSSAGSSRGYTSTRLCAAVTNSISGEVNTESFRVNFADDVSACFLVAG
jgi:hypothetical protein